MHQSFLKATHLNDNILILNDLKRLETVTPHLYSNLCNIPRYFFYVDHSLSAESNLTNGKLIYSEIGLNLN